jgi:tripartite ATP-independent transporter DctM subunit
MAVYWIIGISLLVLLAMKVPVSFAMIISSLLALLAAGNIPMVVVAQRLWGGLESFPLLAIPFFVLAGILLNRGGGAEAIFRFCMTGLGHIRGGLAYVNVVASIIFAGMTGAATADAAGLGAIEIEAMKRDGYPADFAAAVTASSSVIGPIIPPSVPFVVYGVMAQVSIGQLFISGIIPGLLMGLGMMVVIFFLMHRSNQPVQQRSSMRALIREFRRSFLALMCPVVILGGIFSGVFTPTEAGAIASLYALILGFVYKGIRLKDLPEIMVEAMLTTAQVTFIVAAAGLFGWILTRFQFPDLVAQGLMALTNSKYVALLLIAGALLVMGCFIDALSLVIMMTPVVVPIAAIFDINLLQTGVVLVIACMVGLNTPPVGICLYIVSDLAKVPVVQVTRKLLPFYFVLLISLILLSVIPVLSTYLPSVIQL